MKVRMVGRVLAVLVCVLAGAARAETPRLFADCRGKPTASPTVILEAGAFGASADWDYVLDDLARGGRVCAYDRAGLGRSPWAGQPLDALARARQLADMLDDMGETAPVILIGHSNGALYSEAFAKLFPKRTAGLVYVNGVTSDDLDDPLLVEDLNKERELSELAARIERLGFAPVLAPMLVAQERLTGEAAKHKYQSLTCRACVKVARDEDRLVIPGLQAVRALSADLHAIPVVALISTNPHSQLAEAFRAAEIKPAMQADHGWILEARGASHVSPLSRDRAYVQAAVDWLRSAYASLPNPDVGH